MKRLLKEVKRLGEEIRTEVLGACTTNRGDYSDKQLKLLQLAVLDIEDAQEALNKHGKDNNEVSARGTNENIRRQAKIHC